MGEHWYTREGEPCYEVRAASGLPRPTTLADGRKLGLVPSVTTVTRVIDKPALNKWLRRQTALAALTLPRIDGETEDEFLDRVDVDAAAQAKAAAEEGSRIHDACERHYRGLDVPERYKLHVAGVVAAIAEAFPHVTDWIAEASFAHESGFGGKVDLHSPSTGIVVDYKSTDEVRGSTKRFHYDQNWQLAAYQYGLQLPPNVCANVFVSRTDPGAAFMHIWDMQAIADGLAVFLKTLELWKQLKKYDPSFSRIANAA